LRPSSLNYINGDIWTTVQVITTALLGMGVAIHAYRTIGELEPDPPGLPERSPVEDRHRAKATDYDHTLALGRGRPGVKPGAQHGAATRGVGRLAGDRLIERGAVHRGSSRRLLPSLRIRIAAYSVYLFAYCFIARLEGPATAPRSGEKSGRRRFQRVIPG
jgi:hypothetical protein